MSTGHEMSVHSGILIRLCIFYVHRFMRKGEVGSFKSEMPEQFIRRFDDMSARWNNIHNFHEKWIYQVTKL